MMTSDISKGPDGPTGQTITAPTGEQFYLYGKTRIRITEHFAPHGKKIDELLTGLVQAKIKEKVSEIA